MVTNATNESVSERILASGAAGYDRVGEWAIEGVGHGSAPGATDRVRILTWNLWWRFGAWRERRNAIVAEPLASSPTSAACRRPGTIGRRTRPVDRRRTRLALGVGAIPILGTVAATARRHRGRVAFGNAVLSRWPIAESAVKRLPAAAGIDDGRLVLHATVASPFGAIPVFTTQLTSAWGHSRVRQEQVAAVCRFIAERDHESFPPVLTGDFNAPPDADEIRCVVGKAAPPVPGVVLLDAWAYARPLEPGWTWDRRNPHVAATLDPTPGSTTSSSDCPTPGHEATSSLAELVGTQPVDGVWPSDHAGVLVELRGGASDDGVVS